MTNETEISDCLLSFSKRFQSCFEFEDVSYTNICCFVYWIAILITILFFTCLGCLVYKRVKKGTVKVLCTEDDRTKLQFIVERFLDLKVDWITPKSRKKHTGKCLLLCQAKSRIPEDAENVVKNLGLGKNVGNIRLIVAIHNTGTGNGKIVTNRVLSETNQLHLKEIVNVPYDLPPQEYIKVSQIIAKKYNNR